MRVLLSGGLKTSNILNAIEKKFTDSGIEFIVEEYLDDIYEYLDCGYTVDKIILAEQAIVKEDEQIEENELRVKISSFSSYIASNTSTEVIFLTQFKDMAIVLFEESLKIRNRSAIVLKELPYSVSLFSNLVTTVPCELSEELVFGQKEYDECDIDGIEEAEIAEDINNDTFNEDDEYSDETEEENEETVDKIEEDEEWSNDFDNEIEESSIEDNEKDFDEAEWETAKDIDDDLGWEEDSIPEEIEDTVEENINEFENLEEDGELESALDEWEEAEDEAEEEDTEYNSDDLWEDDENNTEDENTIYNELNTDEEIENEAWEDSDNSNNTIESEEEIGETEKDTESLYLDTDNESEGIEEFGDIAEFDSEEINEEEPSILDNNFGEIEDIKEKINDEQEEKISLSDEMYKTEDKSNNMQALYATDNNSIQEESIKTNGKSKRFGRKENKNNKVNKVKDEKQLLNSINNIRERLQPFANRGNSIVVTGFGDSGASTVAYNLANTITNLGYTVLLVDMDTIRRTQSYISKQSCEAISSDDSSLMSAVNTSNQLGNYTRIVKPGLYMLGMGLGGDIATPETILNKEKLSRFTNIVKGSYNFIIYDIPFGEATDFLADITYNCDNIILTCNESSKGITDMMLQMCNVDSEDMTETIFNRGQVIFNKAFEIKKVFGRKVSTLNEILKEMDNKVFEIVGGDIGLYFTDLDIVGEIPLDIEFEKGWYSDIQYSDSQKGMDLFADILVKTVLKMK